MADKKSSNCYNCGQLLKYKDAGLSNFCPHCGQKNKPKTLSFKDLMIDTLGMLFNLENKFFRSVVALLFKPGQLTHDFINGKRVKFVKPIRLFLFSGFLNALLLTLFLFTFDGYDFKIIYPNAKNAINIRFNLETHKDDDTVINREKYIKGYIENLSIDESDSRFMQFINKKHVEHLDITAETFYTNLLKSIFYLNFLMIPVLALIFYLFYSKNSNYVDNVIHSIHIFTFQNFSLVVILLILFLDRIESDLYDTISPIVLILLSVYFLIYLFVSMKRFKDQNYSLTSLKYIGVNLIFPIFYFFALLLSIVLSIAII